MNIFEASAERDALRKDGINAIAVSASPPLAVGRLSLLVVRGWKTSASSTKTGTSRSMNSANFDHSTGGRDRDPSVD